MAEISLVLLLVKRQSRKSKHSWCKYSRRGRGDGFTQVREGHSKVCLVQLTGSPSASYLWFMGPPSAPVLRAADAVSERLNGAPRRKGFRCRKVSHLQTYSGHTRGIKYQAPLPREGRVSIRDNVGRKLQISLESCLLCLRPVFTLVFPFPVLQATGMGCTGRHVAAAAIEEKGFAPV